MEVKPILLIKVKEESDVYTFSRTLKSEYKEELKKDYHVFVVFDRHIDNKVEFENLKVKDISIEEFNKKIEYLENLR